MKNTKLIPGLLVLAITLIVCIFLMLFSVFAPRLITAPFDFQAVLAIILAAFTLEFCFSKNEELPGVVAIILAAVTFGVLPLCAGLVDLKEGLKLGLAGGIAFWAVGMIFWSMKKKPFSSPTAELAAAANALLLFLAAQGIIGIL